MTEWISHFHCPKCEECIDIMDDNLLTVENQVRIDDNTVEQVQHYQCKKCGEKTSIVARGEIGKTWHFWKFTKG